MIVTFGSYGDLLMANGVLRYYALHHHRKLRIVYKKNTAFTDPNCIQSKAVGSKPYYLSILLSPLNRQFIPFNYGELRSEPNTHLMQRMANKLQFTLPQQYVPYIQMPNQPLHKLGTANPTKPRIVFQSTANSKFSPNKQWPIDRIKAVVEACNHQYETIQVGEATDAPLPVHHSLLGSTTFVESAQVIKESNLFVGLEGALMHAAAAVGTKAVIVFGGYIHHHQSGYHTTHAVQSNIECAPCLLTTPCLIQLKCLAEIQADNVINQIHDFLH